MKSNHSSRAGENTRGRAFGRTCGSRPGSARRATRRASGGTLGDFDSDSRIDEAEARAFAALKRLTELGDGGLLRRWVRTDRFLGGFELTTEQAEAARKVLNDGRTELADKVYKRDLELLEDEETRGCRCRVAFSGDGD